jgi:hypothetical protein
MVHGRVRSFVVLFPDIARAGPLYLNLFDTPTWHSRICGMKANAQIPVRQMKAHTNFEKCLKTAPVVIVLALSTTGCDQVIERLSNKPSITPSTVVNKEANTPSENEPVLSKNHTKGDKERNEEPLSPDSKARESSNRSKIEPTQPAKKMGEGESSGNPQISDTHRSRGPTGNGPKNEEITSSKARKESATDVRTGNVSREY